MPSSLNPRHAVYAGSFDPVTLGHADLISRGARIFDQLTVAIGINPDKQPLFTADERAELLRQTLADLPNVTIATFDGLAVNFVRRTGAAVLLRGIRSLMDIESELTLSLTNRTLAPEIETVFLMAGENLSHVSSTLIKQIARFGRDEAAAHLKEFVPVPVIAPLIARFRDGA